MDDTDATSGDAGTAMVSAIAALALVMGRNGALGRERYGMALRRLSGVLNESAGPGERSAMIDRIVAILDGREKDGGEDSQIS